MTILRIAKPTTESQKTTRTVMDTIIFDPATVKLWKSPPFQRPLRINDKVQALAEHIKDNGGVVPGIITLGILDRECYLLDGQHRREAFLLSACTEGFADVRYHYFDTMADMGREFVELNSQLVRMRPDDILRGLEGTSEALVKIRKRCPYVGYDMIRRGDHSPIVSMSALLRCWLASSTEVPSSGGLGGAGQIALSFTSDDADNIIGFLDLAYQAWGRDLDYGRLWANLNLTLCMWLYRRLVITPYSPKTPKLTKETFAKCLMSVSADSQYIDWLLGRQLRDRDRSPCYNRLKTIFARRLEEETHRRPTLPAPPWAHHSGR